MRVCWSHANIAVIEKCVCGGGGGVGTNTRVILGAGVAG